MSFLLLLSLMMRELLEVRLLNGSEHVYRYRT
jgi:hypothetical protein